MSYQNLTDKDYYRYDRQIAVPQFDIEKQELLKNSRFLIIGLGGLGCAASLYLTTAGAGHLTLLDFDVVSESNLARQILYKDQDIGQLKVIQAKNNLSSYRSDINIRAISEKLGNEALFKLIAEHDVILDCTDNLDSREQINKGCFLHKTPLISGSAIRLEGWLTNFTYSTNAPCYHCLSMLFNQQSPQESCTETGVIAPVVGVIGSLQALEAIKMATNINPIKSGELKMLEMMSFEYRTFYFTKQLHCPVCNAK